MFRAIGSYPAEIAPGKPFNLVIGFDNSVPWLGRTLDADNDGFRYRYGLASLSISASFGSLGPFLFTDSGAGGAFLLRDNFTDPNFGDQIDGITFGLNNYDAHNDVFTTVSVLFRRPVLDLFDSSALSGLSGTPDPRLATLRTAIFQVCQDNGPVFLGACAVGGIEGKITAVAAVPEPATYALMALGLVGLAAVRRRTT